MIERFELRQPLEISKRLRSASVGRKTKFSSLLLLQTWGRGSHAPISPLRLARLGLLELADRFDFGHLFTLRQCFIAAFFVLVGSA